jgi:hypothetical protein
MGNIGNCFFIYSGNYNHALSHQQMRAAGHVAGLPYMKNDLMGQQQQQQQQPNKSPLNENNFGGPPSYNNGGGGRGQGGGPPSPKTKLKMEQQQQQHAQAAKMAGMSSINNLNNLSHMAQMRMSSIGYNIGMGYNPSPIARPQVGKTLRRIVWVVLFFCVCSEFVATLGLDSDI